MRLKLTGVTVPESVHLTSDLRQYLWQHTRLSRCGALATLLGCILGGKVAVMSLFPVCSQGPVTGLVGGQASQKSPLPGRL